MGCRWQKPPRLFEQAGENRLCIAIDERNARYPINIDPVAQQAYIKASNSDIGVSFGSAVAVSGNTVVVGAYREKSNATGVNGNQSDNSLTQAGAAYVFDLGTPPVIPGPNPFVITDSSFDGTYFTIHFSGAAGVTDWRVIGSPDLISFSDDWTAGSTIYETSPGIYAVAVDLGEVPDKYFLRIDTGQFFARNPDTSLGTIFYNGTQSGSPSGVFLKGHSARWQVVRARGSHANAVIPMR